MACVKWIWFLIGFYTYTLGYIYRQSMAPLTDVFAEIFDTTSTYVGLLSSVVYVPYFTVQIPAGILLETFSFKFILLISNVGLTIGALLFGISNNLIFSICIQLVNGIFIAPLFITSISIISQLFGNEYVPLLLGVTSCVSYLVFSLTSTIQSYIYDNYGEWRVIYYFISISHLITLIMSIALLFYERNQPILTDNGVKMAEFKQTDKTPLMSVIYRRSLSSITEDLNDTIDTSISNCQKFIDAMKNYLNWILGFWGFGILTMLYAFNGLWLISYMSLKFGYSRTLSTFISSTFFIFSGVGSVVLGKLAKKYRRRTIWILIGNICELSSLALIYIPELPLFMVIGCNIINGFGCGAMGIAFALVREYNEYNQDTSTGLINSLMTSAPFVGQFLIGGLLDFYYDTRDDRKMDDEGDRIYAISDYNNSFIVITCAVILQFIMYLFMKETNAKPLTKY